MSVFKEVNTVIKKYRYYFLVYGICDNVNYYCVGCCVLSFRVDKMLAMSEAPKKSKGRPKDPNSKRSLGLPRSAQPVVAFHLPKTLSDSLDAFVASHELPPRKSDVLRAALAEYLKAKGFWPPKKP